MLWLLLLWYQLCKFCFPQISCQRLSSFPSFMRRKLLLSCMRNFWVSCFCFCLFTIFLLFIEFDHLSFWDSLLRDLSVSGSFPIFDTPMIESSVSLQLYSHSYDSYSILKTWQESYEEYSWQESFVTRIDKHLFLFLNAVCSWKGSLIGVLSRPLSFHLHVFYTIITGVGVAFTPSLYWLP